MRRVTNIRLTVSDPSSRVCLGAVAVRSPVSELHDPLLRRSFQAGVNLLVLRSEAVQLVRG
jgi:hypothetical protein